MSDFKSTSEFEIDRTTKQISRLDIVHTKPNIKSEILSENKNINNIPSSSRYPPSRHTARGYGGISSLNKKTL